MKGMLGLLGVAFIALTAMPASAATLYKCVGADGVSNYCEQARGRTRCNVVSQYTPSRTPAARPRAAPVVATAVRPSRPWCATGDHHQPSGRGPAAGIGPGRQARGSGSPHGQRTGVFYMKDGVRHYSSTRPAGMASVQGVRTISYSFVETCYACAVNPGSTSIPCA